MNVNIEGLNRADVLAALYNASRPLGMGFLQFEPGDMQTTEAQIVLDQHGGGADRVDYLKGRVMKVRLDNDVSFDGDLYDRDNGDGAAQRVVNALRTQQTGN